MKAIRADLPQELEFLHVHVFSDWHIGDKACNMTEIKREIAEVAQNPNAYCILNGDLMNNATKTSVSDSYAEKIPPMRQIETLVELLTPIRDKILMVLQGNHEARTYRTDGIDLTCVVCMKLDITEKYAREGGVLFVRFGEYKNNHRKLFYTIYATHGSGGGRKEGAKAIRLADMSSIVDCDIYIHSHTHLPFIMKESFFRIDPQNSAVAKVDKLFVNTAAKIDEYGGYGQTYEFKPSSIANPKILLDGHKKAMTAIL